MTTATVIRGGPGPLQPAHQACFGRLVRAEWTKIRSVRSTVWSLGILVVTAMGLNTFITAAGMAGWNSLSAATKQGYLADPTGFLAVALNIAQIPACVLGAMVITSARSAAPATDSHAAGEGPARRGLPVCVVDLPMARW